MPAVSASKTPHQRSVKNFSTDNSSTILGSLKENYTKQSQPICRLLDVYLLFCLANGILTAIYYLAAGSFNYNAFLGSFISSVGSFVFAGINHFIHIRSYIFSKSAVEVYPFRQGHLVKDVLHCRVSLWHCSPQHLCCQLHLNKQSVVQINCFFSLPLIGQASSVKTGGARDGLELDVYWWFETVSGGKTLGSCSCICLKGSLFKEL